jgi:hypothetical protein
VREPTETPKSELWWREETAQRIWIEITRRPNDDIGSDIRHNTEQVRLLLKIAKKGDRVIHWDSKRGCFTGVSTIRDSKPRKIGADTGVLLSNFIQFPRAILTLEQIRIQWRLIKKIHDDELIQGHSLYFPLIPYGPNKWKSLRPRLAYLAIAPPGLVDVFAAIYKQEADPRLSPTWESYGLPTKSLPSITKPKEKPVPKYVKANEKQRNVAANWLTSNEALVKSTAKHNKLQNSLSTWLTKNGYEPDSTRAMDKLIVDIKWRKANIVCVCEVKTLGAEESNQLRLGLGQVLSYRFETKRIENLERKTLVKAVLAIDKKPAKNSKLWEDLCQELDVLLIWPGQFQKIKAFMSFK